MTTPSETSFRKLGFEHAFIVRDFMLGLGYMPKPSPDAICIPPGEWNDKRVAEALVEQIPHITSRQVANLRVKAFGRLFLQPPPKPPAPLDPLDAAIQRMLAIEKTLDAVMEENSELRASIQRIAEKVLALQDRLANRAKYANGSVVVDAPYVAPATGPMA